MSEKVCLIVIDGWGIGPESETNAITRARPQYMDEQMEKYPSREILAHGQAVGLPEGVMGNSEVGHLTIGAGRINYQDQERINLSIKKKDQDKNEELLKSFENAMKNGRLHLLTLVSDGGVHSHINHLKYVLQLAKSYGIPNTYVHFFSDGRDTRPKSAILYLDNIIKYMNEEIKYGSIGVVVGRYYAMDRDKRWERIQIAYNSQIDPINYSTKIANTYEEQKDIIQERYNNSETDEFLRPIFYKDKHNINTNEYGNIRDNDTMIFLNFRSDRMREITTAFSSTPVAFPSDTTTVNKPSNLYIVTMTRYDSKISFPVLFPPCNMSDGLAEWISKQGLKQFHTAETEKYAHVTFFFNGGIEEAYPNEDRKLVPSPKVATYDLEPQMNAHGVAESVCQALAMDTYHFIMCNFAPPDMVGHTGALLPAIEAIKSTDTAIKKITEVSQ